MPERTEQLFHEYAAAYARGERPDAEDFLARAGERRDELAELLDRFVEQAPAPAPDVEAQALLAAWVEGETPLLELRTRRGLRRAEVVDALLRALKLEPKRREQVRARYHELESGLLDPDRVDRRVWDALAVALKARVEELRRAPRPAPAFAQEFALFRMADAEEPAPPASAAPAAPPDEVDRLFGVGPPDG